MLRAARSRGEDTRAADARAAIALEAILDGRDADAERGLAVGDPQHAREVKAEPIAQHFPADMLAKC